MARLTKWIKREARRAPTWHPLNEIYSLGEFRVTLLGWQRLDPLSLVIGVDLKVPYYLARQNDRSIEQSRKVLEFDPSFYLAHYTVGWVAIQKRDFATAFAELQKPDR